MKTFRTVVVCGTLIGLGVFPGARAAEQRVNPNSNTDRGGVEVKQVPGRKIGNVTRTAGRDLRADAAQLSGGPL